MMKSSTNNRQLVLYTPKPSKQKCKHNKHKQKDKPNSLKGCSKDTLCLAPHPLTAGTGNNNNIPSTVITISSSNPNLLKETVKMLSDRYKPAWDGAGFDTQGFCLKHVSFICCLFV